MSDHNIIHVTDETFETEVLESTEPVLVDFWAEWCGPCRAMAPILEEIAAEYDGQLKVTKVNVDENAQSSVEYGIRGIPTLMLFKQGRPVERLVGAVSKKELLSRIRNHLGGNGVKGDFYQKFMGG